MLNIDCVCVHVYWMLMIALSELICMNLIACLQLKWILAIHANLTLKRR